MPAKKSKQEIEEHSYTIPPRAERMKVYHSPEDDQQLGEMREAEVFETEHHVYTSPFRYKNVKLDNWLEVGRHKGVELLADAGSITITEKKPIISVTVVGSGCSGRNYNIVEWWGPGESLRDAKSRAPQLIKRQRIDNLKGQHDAWTQAALTYEPPEFKSVEEAREFIERLQKWVYNMTSGYYMPGSLMCGLYENTAHFRIGDSSRPEHTPYKVVIRGGGLDYEDPGTDIVRYPADYTFRLIDVVVKKSCPK